ncbi:MAG TPA: hypothetical protein VM512_16305 [Burkholderiaceae bacterium]|nr:hypothetical protein [Burkholderiaceae bacterium]
MSETSDSPKKGQQNFCGACLLEALNKEISILRINLLRGVMGATADNIALEEVLERGFARKRSNFLDDYGLQDKPVLMWQCLPAEIFLPDISSKKILNAFSQGGGDRADDGWWHGFKSYTGPTLVFDGLASSKNPDDGWVTELHVDGYLSAGLWRFIEQGMRSEATVLEVADFHVNAFRDFAFLIREICDAGEYKGMLHLTATIFHADKLALLSDHRPMPVSPPKRKTFRWPVVSVNVTNLEEAWKVMAAQFLRIYSRRLPQS